MSADTELMDLIEQYGDARAQAAALQEKIARYVAAMSILKEHPPTLLQALGASPMPTAGTPAGPTAVPSYMPSYVAKPRVVRGGPLKFITDFLTEHHGTSTRTEVYEAIARMYPMDSRKFSNTLCTLRRHGTVEHYNKTHPDRLRLTTHAEEAAS